MKFISLIIPLLITIVGTLIPLNALNSKSNLGRTFFTDEQRIKVRYYNTVLLATIIGFGFIYIYLAFNAKIKTENLFETSDIAFSLVWGATIFIFILVMTSPAVNWINNFLIKHHYKYKVKLPEKNIYVYIIRMHDKDTCICSINPNIEYNNKGTYTLIPMQEIMGNTLRQVKIQKPKRTNWSKFLDL